MTPKITKKIRAYLKSANEPDKDPLSYDGLDVAVAIREGHSLMLEIISHYEENVIIRKSFIDKSKEIGSNIFNFIKNRSYIEYALVLVVFLLTAFASINVSLIKAQDEVIQKQTVVIKKNAMLLNEVIAVKNQEVKVKPKRKIIHKKKVKPLEIPKEVEGTYDYEQAR